MDHPLEALEDPAYRQACFQAQRDYCSENELPEYQPWQGVCEACGRDIYGPMGYGIDQAASQLITGCPFCGQSFCE